MSDVEERLTRVLGGGAAASVAVGVVLSATRHPRLRPADGGLGCGRRCDRAGRCPAPRPLSDSGTDEYGDWGLAGLLGLFGLFGYKKYKDHRAARSTGTTGTTGTDGTSRRV